MCPGNHFKNKLGWKYSGSLNELLKLEFASHISDLLI